MSVGRYAIGPLNDVARPSPGNSLRRSFTFTVMAQSSVLVRASQVLIRGNVLAVRACGHGVDRLVDLCRWQAHGNAARGHRSTQQPAVGLALLDLRGQLAD